MGLLFGRSRSILSRIPLVRWIGPLVTLAGVLSAGYSVLTGRVDLTSLDFGSSAGPAATVSAVNLEQLGEKQPETIRVATFNIQVFGDKKSSDAEVMEHLARIVARFDVVAIQEVRTGTALPVDRLVDLINRSGGRFQASVSPPIGRTSQVESYAYVWDATRIMLTPESAYMVRDGEGDEDRMHREPWVASFQSRTVAAEGRQPFTFTLINAHTDPDEVTDSARYNELDVLDDVFVRVRRYEYEDRGEEDFILLGDLNVDQEGLSELGQIPGVTSIAGNVKTNTAGTETYDHIVLDSRMTREFTGRFGVIDFEKDLGLSHEEAIRVSDHLPLWAEFSAYETPHPDSVATAATAGGQNGTR